MGWRGGRSDGEALLPVGSTALLFTDGLIERRDTGPHEGRARLRAVVGELAGQPAEQVCDRVLAARLAGGAEDDVALMVVRPVSAASLPGGRGTLAGWPDVRI